MAKPSWEVAPKWANWLALDGILHGNIGRWVWFEFEPQLISDGTVWFSDSGEWLETDISDNIAHKNTLEQRP